jgi:hypothetical protein
LAVKAISARRIAWTVDAKSIELRSLYSRDEDVPIMRSAIERWIKLYDPGRLFGVGMFEEDDLHLRGMSGEDAEVYTERS